MSKRCVVFVSVVMVISLLLVNVGCNDKSGSSWSLPTSSPENVTPTPMASPTSSSQNKTPTPMASPTSSSQNKTPTPTASPTSSSQNIPTVVPKNVGPSNLNLPGTTTEVKISSKDGATFKKDGVSVVVPPSALPKDGTVTVKEFTQAPPPYTVSSGATPLPTAICISKIYDLGPEGITFAKPVTVTLPYDKSLLENGVDISRITMTYYNGKNWVAAGGLVDPIQGTVTVAMTGFPGELLTIAIVSGLAVVIAAAYGYAGYKVYENVKADPIANNNVKDYVTPNSSTVANYTKRAGALSTANGQRQWIPLEDPSTAGQVNPEFINYAKQGGPNTNNRVTFDGSIKTAGIGPAYTHDFAWDKPDQYFANGMKGDCTSISSAYLSMFRRLGIEAYGVDGNKTNPGEGTVRHSWVELVLNGQPYYYDDDEGIKPLKDVEQYLNRPEGIKGQGYMWDETGQKKYVKSWWGPANMAHLQSTKSLSGKLYVKVGIVDTTDTGATSTDSGPIDYYWNLEKITWNGTSFTGSKSPAYSGDTYLTVKGTVSPDGTQIVSMAVVESPDSPPTNRDYLKLNMVNVLLEYPKNTTSVVFSLKGAEVQNCFVKDGVQFSGHYDNNPGPGWKEEKITAVDWADKTDVPNLQITFQ